MDCKNDVVTVNELLLEQITTKTKSLDVHRLNHIVRKIENSIVLAGAVVCE